MDSCELEAAKTLFLARRHPWTARLDRITDGEFEDLTRHVGDRFVRWSARTGKALLYVLESLDPAPDPTSEWSFESLIEWFIEQCEEQPDGTDARRWLASLSARGVDLPQAQVVVAALSAAQ